MFHYDRIDPPVHGGAHENRSFAHALAERGHQVTIVLPACADADPPDPFMQTIDDGWVAFNGVGDVSWHRTSLSDQIDLVVAEGTPAALADCLPAWIKDAGCDVVLSSESGFYPSALVDAALADLPMPWYYLPKTVHCQPFGPLSVQDHAGHGRTLRRADRVLAPSQFAAKYFTDHGFPSVRQVYFPLNGLTQRPQRPGRDILMINPSRWKGWSHVAELARRFPHERFVFVSGWGTAADIRAALLASAEEKPPSLDRDALFDRTAILLVPSVCYETYGQVVPQALSRGIPVLSSDLGALPEAGMGVAHLVATEPAWDAPHPYHPGSDECDRWAAGLAALLADPMARTACGQAGRDAVQLFSAQHTWDAVCREVES